MRRGDASAPYRLSQRPVSRRRRPILPAGLPTGCHTEWIDTVRIDQWLPAVRITKTRSDAAAACRGGHVTINGKPVKPSTVVKVGDRVEALVNQRERVVDVTRVISKRVGASVAVECFEDHSPPPPERDTFRPLFAVRDRGTGRPTKRDRRKIDQLRGHRS